MPPKLLALLTALLTALAVAVAAVPSYAAPVPEGAEWKEYTITEEDGTKLHADVLRPAHLPADAKTPVILSIGPYFNHAGQLGALGAAQGEDYDPAGPSEGPSARFHDLIVGGRLMERGYTFVSVDLRGFGGSTGCLDWSGPGEQADVREAVTWAATELPGSDGNVGMYGKSYDGVTGLIGAALQPQGLKAVVSQEPVYDLYRYLYSNRVRYTNSLITPALYDGIAGTPGPLADQDEGYFPNSLDDTQKPGCPAVNWLEQQDENHDSAYWRERDLITATKGSDVPLFLTQGFLENNTKPDGAFETFDGFAGPKRAWFGMWDHVRGNDTDADGRLLMGRQGWFDEVMRFYDRHVKGLDVPEDPPVVVQTSDGSWRGEQAWPPADARTLTSALNPGTYADDAQNEGTGEGGGTGVWTFSPPLPHDAHLAGVPRVTLDVVTQLPRANVVADVYDVAPDGEAILVSRGTTMVDESGTVDVELLGNDWKLPAGHRVGVLATSSNSEWWLHVPTFQDVEVTGGSISLPFLSTRRDETLPGAPSVKLEEYREEAPFTVDAATIEEGTSSGFALPAALTAPASTTSTSTSPAPAPAPAASAATAAADAKATAKKKATKRKAVRRATTVHVRRAGRRLVITGRGPSGAELLVRVRRGGRTVLHRRVTPRRGRYRLTVPATRAGRYRVVVSRAGVRGSTVRSRVVRAGRG